MTLRKPARKTKPLAARRSRDVAVQWRPFAGLLSWLASTMPNSTDQLAIALAHHQAGRLNEAADIYRQILAARPDQADALHLLGVLARQQGDLKASIHLIRRALAAQPNTAIYLSNLGNSLKENRQLDQAIAAFREAVRSDPRFAEAHSNLGDALREKGQLDEAIACCRSAIRLQPHLQEAHNNLGNALKDKGFLAEARAAYEEALRLAPRDPVAQFNLGSLLAAQKDHRGAVALFRAVLRAHPNFAAAGIALGNSFAALGEVDAAIEAYRNALTANPKDPQAANNLANVLRAQGELSSAIAIYKRSIDASPLDPTTHANLAQALASAGQADDAIAAFRRSLSLRADDPATLNGLAVVLKEVGQLDDALATWHRAIALSPDPAIHSNLVYLRHFREQDNAGSILAEQLRWAQLHAEPPRDSIRLSPVDRASDRRLRIGYVSPDFSDHVVGRNLLPLFREHDRSRFEVFCYSAVERGDGFTDRFKSLADHWADIAQKPDEAVADQVRNDRIDLLVDLSLHMAGNRLPLFALKPAPVQVTFAGYPAGTGLSSIDARLTDPFLDPPGQADAQYVEKSFRLPHSFWCYDPDAMFGDMSPQPAVGPLPALSSGRITFGSLGNFCKVTAGALDLWAQLLASIPDSELVLLAPEGAHRRRTRDVFAARGVPGDRVRFEGRRSRIGYFDLYSALDIGLDTFPYNGHTTSLDSLWMGVPVVSMVGQTSVSRAGLSQLSNLGLANLCATSPDDYLRIARSLARDLPALADLRVGLRDRMLASPLTDARKFARDIESVYVHLCQSATPAPNR